jgi:hypothetical protein
METEQLRLSLIELLTGWESGSVDEAQVRDTAEEYERMWEGWRVLDSRPTDEEPPLLNGMAEILSMLSDLDTRWVTRTDIPAMLACLESIDDDPIGALSGWAAYANGVDWKARGRGLREDPFYIFTDA